MRTMLSKFIKWTFILLTAGLVLSSGYHAYASTTDLRSYPAPGEMVNVGGHRLHIYCLGEGDPTVVMEAGMSGWSMDWILVHPEVAKTNRVCTYDRAGYGWEDFPPGFSADTIKGTWDELQAHLGESATLPQVIAANSGHYIHLDQPELVIHTILEMVNMADGK